MSITATEFTPESAVVHSGENQFRKFDAQIVSTAIEPESSSSAHTWVTEVVKLLGN